MPSWATAFLTEGFGQGPMVVWNMCMYLTCSLMGYDFELMPVEIREGWSGYREVMELLTRQTNLVPNIYDWFLGAGLVLLNLFCLAGFCRQASRLRNSMTLEMWIELFIKVVLGNVLMLNGLTIIQAFLNVASSASGVFLDLSNIDLVTENIDFGAVMAYILIGILFLIASVVCGIMIVVTVAKRIVNIYLLTCVMPIACATLAGGQGIENSGWAWLKTFLAECFQVVVIALVFALGGKLNLALQSASIGEVNGWFDGFLSVLCDCIYMVFLTVTITGASGFLKRTFDLR